MALISLCKLRKKWQSMYRNGNAHLPVYEVNRDVNNQFNLVDVKNDAAFELKLGNIGTPKM